MKIIKLGCVISALVILPLSAQNKQITVEDIYRGAFQTERLEALHSMNNGQEYAVLNMDWRRGKSSIDVYAYETQEKLRTVVRSDQYRVFDFFTDYQFSADESKVLLAVEEESIYRHSVKAYYFIYDIEHNQMIKLFDQKVMAPTFSPDGSKVAFVYNNDIYVRTLLYAESDRLTLDGKKNAIINGATDWVYEEEFAFVRAFDWNTDGTKIAYLRFDETQVPEFSMDVYGTDLYPHQERFKYPKAGETNASVELYVLGLEDDSRTPVRPPKNYEDFYIPRIQWTKDPHVLSAQFINRHQNELDLWMIDTKSDFDYTLALEEKDKAYVDVTDNLTFLSDNSFIWTSERDGFNHIYHYDKKGGLINQVTQGPWEVTAYYGVDENSKTLYYQSVENGSINRDVFSIKLNGKNKKQLTDQVGTNRADFSADYSYFINTFSSATQPTVYTLNDSKDGNVLKTIKNNQGLADDLKDYNLPQKEFSTLKVNGHDLNMYLIKPTDFDPNKQYPVLMYQYSGPGSQSVANSWHGYNDYWHMMLAQKGLIVACVDGRGTGFKGAEFKKTTQLELGKYEVEDQIQAARQLGELSFVDANRIGIWGWSYGGFMSSNALFKGNDVFSMAIAVAPVTNWRNYDTVYTERFMTTPQENPSGYDDNSPINHVQKLKGDFLLIHGSADDNVHVQNTMQMLEALVQANKQFEWAIYPDKNHGIYGGNTRIHLFNKMTDFVLRTLGDHHEKE